MARVCIPVNTLRKLLRYEPSSGHLFWLERSAEMFSTSRAKNTWNSKYAGTKAFTAINKNGYNTGSIFGVTHYAHIVAWALQTGAWPENQIDHENGIKNDNRFANLCNATHLENHRNMPKASSNTSGVTGVSWNKERSKWVAYIIIEGHRHHLGYFIDFNQAIAQRKIAEAKHGFHVNHGRATNG